MAEHFLNFIISPREAAYRLSKGPVKFYSLLIPVIAAFSVAAGFSLLLNLPGNAAMFFLTWGLAARVSVCLFMCFLLAAAYHFFAGLYGGRCSPGKLYAGLFYAFSPFCFAAPAALVIKAFSGPFVLLFAVFIAVFFLWRFFYGQYNIISYFYGLEERIAASVMLMPWILAAAAFFLMSLFFVTGVIFLIK